MHLTKCLEFISQTLAPATANDLPRFADIFEAVKIKKKKIDLVEHF